MAMQYIKAKGNPLGPNLSTVRRQKSKIIYLLPFYCFLLAGGLVGCGKLAPFGFGGFNFGGGNITKISDIQQNPNANTTVYLQGQVETRAPFLGSGAYKLQDATGTIWVLTDQTLPNVGDAVSIKGQLQFQSIPFDGQELGEVYVQEQDLLDRKAGQPGQPVPPQGNSNL
jgi:hypothetical protein